MAATGDVTSLAFDRDSFEHLLQSRSEPAWVSQERRSAFEAFVELDWPARRSEEWMRTDYRPFRLERFAPPVAETVVDHPRGLLSENVSLAGQLVTVNSHPARSQVLDRWRERGVLFGPLDELLAQHGDQLRPYFTRHVVHPTYDRFAALNSAFWTGGQLLFVPRNVTVEEPFHCLSILAPGGVDLGRLLVIVEEGAEATVLCESESAATDGAGLHCGIAELIAGPRANVRFVQLQNWNEHAWHFAHQRAVIHQDATLQWTIAAMGSRLSKVNQQVELAAPGANCQVNGVLFAQDKQHLNYQTLQHHAAPHCRSDFLYKTALQDHARTVWRGMIKVDHGAIKTDGYQRNDNLLLSDHARADSIPGLEIEADDVRCTHGSTSGKVDEELIFYAQCRGLTRTEATRMIVTGFFQQIFDRITIDRVREALGGAIARRVREYE